LRGFVDADLIPFVIAANEVDGTNGVTTGDILASGVGMGNAAVASAWTAGEEKAVVIVDIVAPRRAATVRVDAARNDSI